MADNEFTLPMDYEPTEDISVNAVQATEDPGKFLQEGSGPAIVETSLDKVSDAGTASQDWLVESFAQAATGTFNTPDLWKNRKPTTVEEIGRSLVHGFAGPVKSTLSGVVKTAAYAEAAMEDAEHGLAELIVGRSFPNRNFGRALIHSMNEQERSEAWERTLYENRQGIKSDAWYNMLASAFGSSAALFGAAVKGVPAKTLSGAEGLMIGASYFSEQSSKLESAGESGAKALPFAVFIGTLGGLIAKTGGEAIISDAVQSKFGPAAVSFARSSTDNLVKRISKRLLNPVAKKAAKAEAIEELAQEASTIGTEKIQDAVLGTQVNQSTWQEDTQRMFVGLAGGATVGGLVGEYVYNKNLNKLQKKLEPVFEGDKNKSFEAATAIADAVLNEVAAENAAVKSLEGHVADLNPELAQVLSHVFEDLVNQGFVDFRQATPDEVRQAGLDWANLMSAAAILDAMERNIPLRTHPLFKAIAEIDRILLEGRDPSTGDLLPLDINNAQVRELANQIEDYIEQNRETRQAEEASKLAALREADMRARQETIQELERAAIAELEKEQVANNQERITELQQQITELQHQMDLLREERSQYVKERAAQGRISIGRAKAQTAPDNKTLTKKAIRSGNLDIIKQILQDNGFKTRDLSGTQIKQMAQLNWEMFAGRDLGMAKSKYDQSVAMKAIQQNVVSGDAVLLRAGYTQGQIDQMDDKTWNRALQAAYREETEALESAQPQLTPEQAAQIPDDLQYQDTPFDLAAENARLDDIYPEYKGETINIDGKERTVYNSDGERIAKSEPALRNFYKWFGDSKVVDKQGRPLVVYHGTRAEFDTFDILKIGSATGDYGAYGHGFYFTQAKKVADSYGPKTLSVYLSMPNMIKWNDLDFDTIIERIIPEFMKVDAEDIKRDLIISRWIDGLWDIEVSPHLETNFVEVFNSADVETKHDILQELLKYVFKDISRQHNLLGYEFVSNAITEQAKEQGADGILAGEISSYYNEFVAFEPNQIKSIDNTGEFGIGVDNIYHQDQVVKKVGEDRTNADKQIKQGTVFQNKKTSKSTTGLGTEHRGGYDPITKAIIFNKTSDLTTLFHESAHYWFDRNLRYYRTGLASPEWKKKWEDVMNELGATPNARGTIPVSAVRSASEKFARSMEAYLREGKYESAAIQWAHQDYANMVKRVYRNIWSTYWGLDDLSPAVKQWFDMFGLKTDDATTAFAEEDKIETDEQMVGAVIAEDATKPDVDTETKAIVADAGAQVVENPATQEIAVVPADPFETGKKARSKLPRSAEAATGVSMDDIIYNRRSMSDAFKAAQQLVNTNPVRAWEILKGDQEMVDGLYAGDIYRALIAKYQAENNPTMLKNVVQAFAGAARRAGRSVKAFDLESPRISFEKTINSLDKIFDTKKNDKRIEKVKNELKEFLHDPSALRVGWEEFKNIVGCK